MTRQLDGMVVAITGASAGIGRAVAEQLSAAGAKLALCARRVDRLEELNRALGGKHLIMRADVSSPTDCGLFVLKTLDQFGRIDTLIANAGYGQYKTVFGTSNDDIQRMFATNVFGTTELIRVAVPHMQRQEPRGKVRGQVMIVSSAAARRGVPYLGPYAATKAAQLSIAEALRVELKSSRIAVTSVHPIMTNTEFGTIAEAEGGVKLPRHMGSSQSVEHVARRMVQAIQSPRPEVWPHRPTRIAVLLGSLFPRMADKVMLKYLRELEKANRPD